MCVHGADFAVFVAFRTKAAGRSACSCTGRGRRCGAWTWPGRGGLWPAAGRVL